MAGKYDDLLPPAGDLRRAQEQAEAAKAAAEIDRRAEEAAARRALIVHLSQPLCISEEETVKRGAAIIRRAAEAGLSEVEVFRFPNAVCTDRGRAINYAEPGWEQTLTGAPKGIYDVWCKHFRPRGYRLKAYIVDFPGGFPGDVALALNWA
jgi:hypothetical protein